MAVAAPAPEAAAAPASEPVKVATVRRVASATPAQPKVVKTVRKVASAAADANPAPVAEADAPQASAQATATAKPAVKAATKTTAKAAAKPAAKSVSKAKPKAKAKGKDADLDDADLSDIDDDLEGEPEAAETTDTAGTTEAVATVEKVKPLRMKISKAKEKALMKEFGLDDTVLSEEEVALRRQRLKTLIKLGKTRGYLTHGEINDHLPDKLVEAETLEVVISLLNDMGVAVYEQTPDAETLLLNNTGPTAATEEEAEEEAEAAL
ncbi:MAG: RNA polymerase sigma factor region1.1 domain-containing protein, partial [Burkholderiaceae bacterium]|nr:RNA polymerase sigma factor region1.1 domain-containing protein [Burkholderiaceae bacterium]